MPSLLPRGFSLRGPGLALVALAATTGSPVGAAPGEGPRPPAPVKAEGCPRQERSALRELSCEIARELGPSSGASVSAGPPSSDRILTNGNELAGRLIRQVTNALGPDVQALGPTLSIAEARRAAKRSPTLVFLTLSIAGGDVRVTADSEPTSLGFWDRLRGKTGGTRRHGFASRRIDGEIATFLPSIPLVADQVEKAAHSTTDVVAVTCGDVDGDSALEVAVVGRRKIQLGRVRAHRFEPLAETTWADLGPIAPSPLREPIAAASVHSGHGLLVGSTDRRTAAVLLPSLQKSADLGAVLPVTGLGCVGRAGIALAGVTSCADTTVPAEVTVTNADAVAGGIAVDRAGRSRRVTALRSAADGMVSLADDAKRTGRAGGLGGALAVADLDRDGVPELVASTDAKNPADDALVVQSWDDTGALRERYRLPVPEGIRALAVCPPGDAGLSAIVVATPSHLWLVR